MLADIQKCGGVDQIWVLGDIVALGPAPVETLERLTARPNVVYLRGNTERYVCTGDRPPPTLDQAAADPAQLPVLVEVAGSFAWTQGAVSQGGWLDWLSALPPEQRAVLPDGTRMLGVHARPGFDDGPGFYPALTHAGQLSYVPPAEAFAEGGYEVELARRRGIADDAQQRILDSVRRELFGS